MWSSNGLCSKPLKSSNTPNPSRAGGQIQAAPSQGTKKFKGCDYTLGWNRSSKPKPRNWWTRGSTSSLVILRRLPTGAMLDLWFLNKHWFVTQPWMVFCAWYIFLSCFLLPSPAMAPGKSCSSPSCMPCWRWAFPASWLPRACCKARCPTTKEERHCSGSQARSNTANKTLKLQGYSGQSTADDCSDDSHLICMLSMPEIIVPLCRAVSSLG